jgi:hypothetical protein
LVPNISLTTLFSNILRVDKQASENPFDERLNGITNILLDNLN